VKIVAKSEILLPASLPQWEQVFYWFLDVSFSLNEKKPKYDMHKSLGFHFIKLWYILNLFVL
jgi:hypothetical protein